MSTAKAPEPYGDFEGTVIEGRGDPVVDRIRMVPRTVGHGRGDQSPHPGVRAYSARHQPGQGEPCLPRARGCGDGDHALELSVAALAPLPCPGDRPRQQCGAQTGRGLTGHGRTPVVENLRGGRAAGSAVFGSFHHQGQICVATNRIAAQNGVFDEIVDRVRQCAQQLRTGAPSAADTQIGPNINDKQLEGLRDKITRSVTDRAELLVSREPAGPAGRVLPPHVPVGDNHVASADEEAFGPVATVIRAEDEEDAPRIANSTDYDLSSAVFTGDLERGVRFARRVHAGMTHVDDITVNDEPNTAFGGEKDSGLDRFGGQWAIDAFTTDHWVSVRHTRRDLPFGVGT